MKNVVYFNFVFFCLGHENNTNEVAVDRVTKTETVVEAENETTVIVITVIGGAEMIEKKDHEANGKITPNSTPDVTVVKKICMMTLPQINQQTNPEQTKE